MNVPVEEALADSIAIRVHRYSKDIELKVSDLVLKACKETGTVQGMAIPQCTSAIYISKITFVTSCLLPSFQIVANF